MQQPLSQDLEDLLQELEREYGAQKRLSQDVEELLQELKGEYDAPEPLPRNVEYLLQVLQSGNLYLARRDAAEKLVSVETSSPRIVRALVFAYESDPASSVNRAAAESLRAPAHQACLQQHTDLMKATERVLQHPPGAQESLPRESEELLRVLQSGEMVPARWEAAEQLGNVGTKSPRIVRALIIAAESDLDRVVRRAAANSLRAPVHQQYLHQYPESAARARVPESTSFLRSGNLRYWLLAALYSPFLIGATYLAVAVDGGWTFLVAAAVWFIGGGLGLHVLSMRGYSVLARVTLESLDAKGLREDLSFMTLVVIGPFLLLAALLIRTREPGYDAEVRPEEQQQRRDRVEATEKALQMILSSDTASEPMGPEAPLTDLRSGGRLSGLHSALLSLFVALSVSAFLITIDQLSILRLDYLGVTLLNLLIGPALVGAVTGACYSYCAAGETTSSAGTTRAALGAAAGVLHAVVNLVRNRVMFSLPGYGWTSGELEYFFAISLGGNALFGAMAGLIGGALVGFARGRSTARRTTRVGRWPLVGGLLLIAISVGIWVIIIATTTK